MRTTIYDVAKKAGVGIGTVSRVLNNHPSVSEQTRNRVLEAINELGYTPHAMARGLALHKTNSIGILVPFFTHHFFVEILKGIQMAAYEYGLDLILYNVQSSEQKAKYFKKISAEKKVDGIILITLNVRDEDIQTFKKANIPVVLVDSYHRNVTCLTVDNVAGAMYATDHLLDLGHTRIGFLNGLMRYHSSRDRLHGYKLALARRSIPIEKSLIVESEFSRSDGFKAMETLWNKNKKLSAVFAASDLQAIGVIKYLSTQGVRVPEDVSVVGFDNIELAELVELTTISQPMHQMGADAMQILVKHLATSGRKGGDTIPTVIHKTYTPRLVTRKSTLPKRS
jgi:DNA-binding LacI/PurR family transcriptional regulator